MSVKEMGTETLFNTTGSFLPMPAVLTTTSTVRSEEPWRAPVAGLEVVDETMAR